MKKNLSLLTVTSLFATALMTSLASAQSNQSTVQVEQKSTWDQVKEKLRLQYVGELTGPSLNRLSEPGLDGNPSGPINLDNKIAAGYRFNRQWSTDFTFDFQYNPLGATPGVIDPANAPFSIRDPFIRVSNSQIIHTDIFNLSGDLRLYLPLSNGSQAASMVGGLRNTLFSNITLPNSRWSFGHFSLLRLNSFVGPGNGKGNVFSANFALHGDYQILDNLSLYLWTDLIGMDVGRTASVSTDPVNAQVGVSWDINNVFNLNPYIKVLPGNLSLYTTTINMVVTASIF